MFGSMISYLLDLRVDDSDSEAFECVQSTICEGLNTELKSSAGYIPFAQHAIEVVSNSDDCIFHHF